MVSCKFETMQLKSVNQEADLINGTLIEYKLSYEILENEVPQRYYLIFDTLNINWDFQTLMEANDDLMDLTIINKYFSRENLNYKIRNKVSWHDRVIF
jgi:hypothetical protein